MCYRQYASEGYPGIRRLVTSRLDVQPGGGSFRAYVEMVTAGNRFDDPPPVRGRTDLLGSR